MPRSRPSLSGQPTHFDAVQRALAARALSSRMIIAGTGLTGGGPLTGDVTLAPDFGTGPGKVVEGNDSRFLSVLAHAASHAAGGGDAVTLTQAQITGLVTALGLLAPLLSPTFAGTPAAPTAAPGTNTTQISTTAFVMAAVAALVASSPGTLDTLDELAAALGDDPNFATTLATLIGTKVAASLYDANTILKADSNDTPVALTMGASTILARLAAGNIVAATPAEIRTLLGLGALALLATVGSSQIDNDAVTYAKIQNVSATDKLLGRSTAGAGDVEEIACTAAGRALIDDATTAAQRVTLGVVRTPTIWSAGNSSNTLLLVNDKAYFLYMGEAEEDLTIDYVQFYVGAVAGAAAGLSCGVFSTPVAANGGTQTVTKIAATNTTDAINALGWKSNSSALAAAVPKGTHWWLGVRSVTGALPQIRAFLGNTITYFRQLETAGAGDLQTTAGPWTGVLPTTSAAATGLDLNATSFA